LSTAGFGFGNSKIYACALASNIVTASSFHYIYNYKSCVKFNNYHNSLQLEKLNKKQRRSKSIQILKS